MQGMIIPLSGGGTIVFQYHPERIRETYAAVWVPLNVAGREIPYLQYTHGEEHVLEFELRYASKGDPGYVKGQLNALRDLMRPTVSLGSIQAASELMLILGADLRWRCVLRHMHTRKHTYADETLQWFYGDARLVFFRTLQNA